MNWIQNLYEETKQKWMEFGKNPSGYAIFYTPVNEKPTIALIGYNPGGDSSSFDENSISVPLQHEYFLEDYKLAKNVKKIFAAADSMQILEASVKFNLIFFRSKKAEDFNNSELIQYCKDKVVEILFQIKPKLIITEGFKTYAELSKLVGIQNEKIVRYHDKAIMIIGRTENGTLTAGMIHPSGARGVSDAMLCRIGEELKCVIESLQ